MWVFNWVILFFHNLAAAITSFYLSPRNKPLKYIWEYSPFPLRHKLVRCLWVFIIFISFRFIFHHEPRSHPVAKFYNDTRYLGYGIGLFNYVPLFLSKPLEWSIYYLNKIINSIASFENFIIRDIPLNTYLLWVPIAYSCKYNLFKKPNFNKLIIVLLAIIAIQITYIHTQWIKNQQEWVILTWKGIPW
jgi:competence protein ComEC